MLYVGGGPYEEIIVVTNEQGELGVQVCLCLKLYVGSGPYEEIIVVTNKQGELGAFMDVFLEQLVR